MNKIWQSDNENEINNNRRIGEDPGVSQRIKTLRWAFIVIIAFILFTCVLNLMNDGIFY